MRLIRRLVKLVVALVLLAAIAYALFATVLRLPGGPVDDGVLRSTGRTGLSVGDSATFLAPAIRNGADRPVTIERIEAITVPRGVRVRGIRVASRLPRGGGTSLPGWPRRLGGGVRAQGAADYELEGGATARAVVGVRITRPGSYVVRGLRVEYRDRGLRRVAELGHEYTVSTRR